MENVEFADGTVLKASEINVLAHERYGTSGSDTIEGYGTESGYDNNETIHGLAGNDVIYGYAGNDTIHGDEGNDSIYGGTGNDVLEGGTGNDYVSGETGNDTYIFNLGDGADTIYDYEYSTTSGRSDRIIFGEGISREDVVMERVGYDLVIRYSDTDRITVKNAYYYSDGRCFVENIEFKEVALYKINYDSASMELVESYTINDVKENTEINADISSANLTTATINMDEVVLSITSSSIENVNDNNVLESNTLDDNKIVDNMVNILAQEMSETTINNEIDMNETISTLTCDNIQLWVD